MKTRGFGIGRFVWLVITVSFVGLFACDQGKQGTGGNGDRILRSASSRRLPGRRLGVERRVDVPKGEPDNPLSGVEIHQKFHQLADPVIGVDRAVKVIRAVECLPAAGSIGRPYGSAEHQQGSFSTNRECFGHKEREMTLTSDLANYFSELQFAQIPAEKKTDIKRLLLDYLGVALAGSRTDTGRIAAEFAIELGGSAQATLIGRGNKVPAVHAAFANAISSHSIELDDIDDEALFHYSPPVYSAGLAAAEMAGASGAEFLTAVYAGCEMMNRLSRATNPSLRDRGFHTTPTCGVFGGTVAAGKLLKLSPQQMTHALGLAGAQASGLMEMYGTSMQKRINPGPAARNAVTAASLAKKGFTGADTIIEGKRGFAAAFSNHFDPSKLTEGLGREFPVTIEFKPYSCARPIHNAIDCALNVRGQNSFKLDQDLGNHVLSSSGVGGVPRDQSSAHLP